MVIKDLKDEDFTNYKECSMFIGFPTCTFKCEKECGLNVCQNSKLANAKNIEIEVDDIYERYMNNQMTHAIVCGGLEPFDTFYSLLKLIHTFRVNGCSDTFVIYTGYKKHEIELKISQLKLYNNIIVKFGRFIPDQDKHKDEILGIYLASPNQYAEVIC